MSYAIETLRLQFADLVKAEENIVSLIPHLYKEIEQNKTKLELLAEKKIELSGAMDRLQFVTIEDDKVESVDTD